MISKHFSHNQRVERHVILGTEAAISVAGQDNRYGMICPRIKPRKLIKQFETKEANPRDCVFSLLLVKANSFSVGVCQEMKWN